VAELLHKAMGEDDREDVLGLVFPVHAWGIPKMMEEWLEPLMGGDRKWEYVYLVMTCGSEAGYCERTFPYAFNAAFSVVMPNTYVGLPFFGTDGEKLERKKLKAAVGRVEEIARGVKERSRVIDVKRGIWPWLMTYKIRPFFSQKLAVAKHIHLVEERCNGCGRCAQQCPLGNITMQHGRPVHGEKCCLCLGCFHNCHKQAIWVGPYGKGKRQKGMIRMKE